jgi:hypothetical protein
MLLGDDLGVSECDGRKAPPLLDYSSTDALVRVEVSEIDLSIDRKEADRRPSRSLSAQVFQADLLVSHRDIEPRNGMSMGISLQTSKGRLKMIHQDGSPFLAGAAAHDETSNLKRSLQAPPSPHCKPLQHTTYTTTTLSLQSLY